MKLKWKFVELLIFVAFCLFSLRVLNWFEYPYILISGDLRPPLNNGAFVKRVLYMWDEIDFGLLSVYPPRILDPFNFFTTIFQTLGINLYFSQMVAVFSIYFLASIFMYVYVKQLTNGDVIAAFVAALFLTSNVHLIVDREQTAIGFINTTLMILPCLVTFTRGIKTKSYILMVISGLLFNLTYGAFPNYRVTLLCLMALAITCLFLFVNSGLTLIYRKNSISSFNISLNVNLLSSYLRVLLVFVVSLLLASIWVITLVLTNLEALLSSYENMAAPPFVLYLRPYDVLRLIAKWAFYEKGWGKPYVPYANVYFDNPLIVILSYFPSILAFMGLLFSKSRKLTIYFSVVAALSLLLTSAFNPYFSQLYSALATYVPLMIAFRESTHWILFVIMSYSVLIGMTLSSVCHKLKHIKWQLFAISLTIALFASTSFPLITGDVTRNWLKPDIKGSYVPSSYAELDSMISNDYWTILLPQRGTYVSYNFSDGVLACGNPYPLLFSKPVISGIGTEYIRSENDELFNEIHDALQHIRKVNIAPDSVANASTVERSGLDASKAIDGLNNTRWSSDVGVPQWLEIEWNQSYEIWEIKITFESAYARKFSIEAWNQSEWKTLATIENNDSTEFTYSFSQPVVTNKLRFIFTEATKWSSISIWELEVFVYTEEAKFLGMMGIKYLILEKSIIYGNTYDIDNLKLQGKNVFTLVKDWDDASLFENAYAVEKLYVADNPINVSQMQKAIATLEWNTLKHSMFVDKTLPDKKLSIPQVFTWKQVNPTLYEINVENTEPFILVLLENFDQRWKAYVNGSPIPETNHYKVNIFANGWLIDTNGKLQITIQHETQSIIQHSVIASAILPTLFLMLIYRKDVKKIASLMHSKWKTNK